MQIVETLKKEITQMQIIDYFKIAGIALLCIFALFCAFKAIKKGFFSFLGCLFICAIGFIVGVYFADKTLFDKYFNIVIEWVLPFLTK